MRNLQMISFYEENATNLQTTRILSIKTIFRYISAHYYISSRRVNSSTSIQA